MLTYFLATALTLFFAMLACKSNKEELVTSRYLISRKKPFSYNLFFAVLSAIPLTLIAAIRYDIGIDYGWVFRDGFILIRDRGIMPPWEIGFLAIARTVLLFTGDYAWMFAVVAILTSIFVFHSIYSISNNIPFSILLYVLSGVYFSSFNTIRQALSIAMFIYAIKFIPARKLVKYLFVVCLAATIHTSAIILILFYWVYNIRISPKRMLLIAAFSAAFFPFVRSVFIHIVSMTRYYRYIGGRYDADDWTIAPLIMAIPIIVLGYFYWNNAKDNKMYNFYMNLQLIAFILSIYSSQLILIHRVQNYFTATQLFLVPLIVAQEKNPRTKMLLVTMFIALFLAYCIVGYVILGWSGILPYRTIFSR